MGAAREEVKRLRVLQLPAARAEQRDVAGKRRGVAGDVDKALRRHTLNGVNDVGSDALSRRVDNDHIGADALLREHLCRLTCIGAEEARVCDAVAAGIFLCVGDGGGDDLNADGLLCAFGGAERDRAGAAVEIEHGLRAVELCRRECGIVEPFGLIAVDLIERGGRNAKAQAAQDIFDRLLPPKHARGRPEDGVAVLCVIVDLHGGKPRDLPPEQGDQKRRLRQGSAVKDGADQNLTRGGGAADKDMTQKSLSARLVIGSDAALPRPLQNGSDGAVGAGRLDQAALHGNDAVCPFPEKSGGKPFFCRGDGVLCLVAVALAALRAGDGNLGQRLAADAVQRVEHALRLQFQLCRVGQVPEGAATAKPRVRAFAVDAAGGFCYNPKDRAVGGVLSDVRDAQVVFLVRRGVRDEYGAAVHTADAKSFAGKAGDDGAMDLLLF